MSRNPVRTTGIFLALALAVAGCPQKREGGGAVGEAPKKTVSEAVKVEFFVMSQCPFGTQVEDAIAPVLKKFGGDVEFTIDFIGDNKDGKLSSMHGENEVNGDKVQLCAVKYAPYKYMDMLTCMNKNARGIPDNWQGCAQETGMPVGQIKTCYEGQEGTQLLSASFDKARSRNARGSPTIYIAGKMYNGARSELAFSRAICDGYTKEKPALCASLPPPVKVPITIISDARCKDCRADFWQKRLEGMFPGAVVKILDWSNEEGKKLWEGLNKPMLPAILMGQEVKQADDYARVQRFLAPAGDFLIFQVGSRFDTTKEICDNKTDDNGNGKVDCDDADCANALECRKDIPKKLEVFVMSQCPFGVKALDAMKEVLDAFERKIQFEIHYIADLRPDGSFNALHGQPEVDENIRELCAIKYYPKNYKYMDYIWCRNKNIRDANWQACATKETGIDAAVIEKCFSGDEGKKLLAEDIKIAQGLGIGGSPTWFANNKNKFSGIDAQGIKTQFCNFNQGLKGCEKTLSGPEKPQPGRPAPACGQ
ncbi:MAG: thioredoxin domain-containing protein [Myxococcales bacterium]|nr:thioredoxin domain-containing protein [Myxococcales bacterium]